MRTVRRTSWHQFSCMFSQRFSQRFSVFILLLGISLTANAQIFQAGNNEDDMEYPADTLERRHEWWLGVGGSAFYAVNFGTLTVDVIGGTAPDQPKFTVTPQGGMGYGIAFGPVVEYRPIHSDIGVMLSANVDWRWMEAETTVPIEYDIFAINATFEAQSTVLYATGALSVKAQLGVTGSFAMVGVIYDQPISTIESYVWQHEVWEGEAPSDIPGAPQTSIKFNTVTDYKPRFGIQVGFGHDFLAGMFGYRGQLITPYVILQGGTPVVSDPTAWNSVSFRLGVMWRAGID